MVTSSLKARPVIGAVDGEALFTGMLIGREAIGYIKLMVFPFGLEWVWASIFVL
jgi:hypothetical protein